MAGVAVVSSSVGPSAEATPDDGNTTSSTSTSSALHDAIYGPSGGVSAVHSVLPDPAALDVGQAESGPQAATQEELDQHVLVWLLRIASQTATGDAHADDAHAATSDSGVSEVQGAVTAMLQWIQPSAQAEAARRSVFDYVSAVVATCVPDGVCHACGSWMAKTYLPDSTCASSVLAWFG